MGFTLDEIAGLLKLNSGKHCAETRAVAEQKIAELEGKIGDLKAVKAGLTTLVRACGRAGNGVGCPIIEALVA